MLYVHVSLCVTRADGVMRTMNTEKLIKTLPIIQNQLDALLDFQVSVTQMPKRPGDATVPGAEQASPLQPNSNELTNGVINTAFMLLFKDSIRLFAAYNEGVINMLGKAHKRVHVAKPQDTKHETEIKRFRLAACSASLT